MKSYLIKDIARYVEENEVISPHNEFFFVAKAISEEYVFNPDCYHPCSVGYEGWTYKKLMNSVDTSSYFLVHIPGGKASIPRIRIKDSPGNRFFRQPLSLP